MIEATLGSVSGHRISQTARKVTPSAHVPRYRFVTSGAPKKNRFVPPGSGLGQSAYLSGAFGSDEGSLRLEVDSHAVDVELDVEPIGLDRERGEDDDLIA